MLSVTRTPELDVTALRRAIIRSAAGAVSQSSPLDVIDPRGMIFDRDPGQHWTLRVRGSERQMVLGLGEGKQPWVHPDALEWRVLPLEEDPELPGRMVLGEPGDLAQLTELTLPLRTSLVTYRRGRRAVLRVASGADGTARFVKLLSRRAFRKARRALGTIDRLGLERVLLPRSVHEDFAALVFDEITDPSLHDQLWAGQAIDLSPVFEGVESLATASGPDGMAVRSIATERDSAQRLLSASVAFLPGLRVVLDAVRAACLPEIAPTGLIHGDLHDKQIFMGASGIRLIDAESLAIGAPEIDLVNLVEHLRLRGLQGCQEAPACVGRMWLQSGLDRDEPPILALRALVRARLAGVYARRPWWWEVAGQLADEATGLLERLP